jgi:hypothetical protein
VEEKEEEIISSKEKKVKEGGDNVSSLLYVKMPEFIELKDLINTMNV